MGDMTTGLRIIAGELGGDRKEVVESSADLIEAQAAAVKRLQAEVDAMRAICQAADTFARVHEPTDDTDPAGYERLVTAIAALKQAVRDYPAKTGCPNCPPGFDCATGNYATEPALTEEVSA